MKAKALRETAVPFYFGHFAARSFASRHWLIRCAIIGHFISLNCMPALNLCASILMIKIKHLEISMFHGVPGVPL
ncbi:hypothetical protein [Mucilaginibacter sp.]|uniref:hypothetical protein n=1 Tax=Mucilaginibacter sp. TaxID=1882438 RepID=UPI00374DAF07